MDKRITVKYKTSCELNNEIMRYTFEEEFRLDHPETVGETDSHFNLDNYKDWLEAQLIEARKQLALYNVVGQSEQLKAFADWLQSDTANLNYDFRDLVDEYLKSL